MARYDHMLLVCTNDRGAAGGKKSCAQSGSPALLARLRTCGKRLGRHDVRVRSVGTGCLGLCQKGCVVVAFSGAVPAPQTWYSHVQADDAEALFDAHIVAGRRLERLVEVD